MLRVFAINGSPNQTKGNTAMILEPFLEGLTENNAAVDLYYASQLKVKPCSCGNLYCWNKTPGKCILQDSMQTVYPVLRESDILVLATPIYIPLPGDLQNFLNRLCALIDPVLTFRDGRTRARFHADVHIKTLVLLAAGGWWEKENFDTLIRIVKELAEDASINFAGAILRLAAYMMCKNGQITDQGKTVLQAIKGAAGELIHEGWIHEETLATICQPLISFEEAYERYFSR